MIDNASKRTDMENSQTTQPIIQQSTVVDAHTVPTIIQHTIAEI